ncbi:MAG: DegV family protein, partial [Candidatus Heimdallarchaeota archaeon]
MKSVVIITDDTCDMPLELIEKYNISLISIKIIFSDKAYRSCGVKGDLTIDEYYQRVEKEIPTTSTASPGIITECLNSAFEQAEAVIGIFLSNNLSPVVSNTQALINQSYSDKKIKIYDSSVTSVGLAALVLEAAILASQDATFDEICSKVDNWIDKTNFAGIMFTLENLVRTGRVPKTKKFLADFFKVKPVVEMIDGQIDVQGKIRADDKVIIEQMKNLGRNALENM